VQARPVRLNAIVATLFMVGSACFALGSVPAYASAVGALPTAVTYFVGSLFFTSASFGQLLQAQTPAMAPEARTEAVAAPLRARAWLPHDRGWRAAATQFPGTLFFNASTAWAIVQNLSVTEVDQHVWRPDLFGSLLFLVSSGYALLALGGAWRRWVPTSWPWWIGWLNMAGSIAFMASAIAAYVVPTTGAVVNPAWADGGTLVGAICFFVGAALMLPAWRSSVGGSRTRGSAGR
jgi:hypothetical protein